MLHDQPQLAGWFKTPGRFGFKVSSFTTLAAQVTDQHTIGSVYHQREAVVPNAGVSEPWAFEPLEDDAGEAILVAICQSTLVRNG